MLTGFARLGACYCCNSGCCSAVRHREFWNLQIRGIQIPIRHRMVQTRLIKCPALTNDRPDLHSLTGFWPRHAVRAHAKFAKQSRMH